MRVAVKRIRRDVEGSRDNILSAAESLIRDTGPDGFKLTEVAKRAGVTHSNVIAHFGSVLELQRQTASRIAGALIGEIATELGSNDLSVEPVRQVVETLFVALARDGNRKLFAWIMVHDQLGELPGLSEGLAVVQALLQARLLARGKQEAVDPALVGGIMRLVIGAALGGALTGRYLDGLGATDPQQQAALMAKLLYNSFG